MPAQCPYKLVDSAGQPVPMPHYPLRSDIPPVPASMSHLPVDERGYPVPFFVGWAKPKDGEPAKPEFRGASRQVVQLAISDQLCWVCGLQLNRARVFVIGPMCAVNRISAEPPSHPECARYSAIACPFLTKPQMHRREGDFVIEKEPPPGHAILRNPGVTLLWFANDATSYELLREPNGVLWHFTREPVGVEWYCRGRAATRAEVMASVESGLPIVRGQAEKDGPEFVRALESGIRKAMRLVPR